MSKVEIKRLLLKNFRNIQYVPFEFSTNLNCIFGQNGNGKTNLLEAIYYLTNKKSFKKNTDLTQMISLDCDSPQIEFSSIININNEEMIYSGKIEASGNSIWYLNNEPTKKRLNSISVFISPFEANLFNTNITFRRDWFDDHFSYLDPQYKKTISNFNKLLKMRNTLLKEKPYQYVEQITSLDPQLCEYTYIIEQLRLSLIRELNEKLTGNFYDLFSKENKIQLDLVSPFREMNQASLNEFYKSKLKDDIKSSATTKSLRRDDFQILYDGLNAFEYCSLGQQKMAFLSLLFAYIELFRYKFNLDPIVLIDDVSGELDALRWKNLIDYVVKKNFQVFITTANENFKNELLKIGSAKKITLKNGQIVSEYN